MFATHYEARVRLPGKPFRLDGEITAEACLRLAGYCTADGKAAPSTRALALEIYCCLCDGKTWSRGKVDAKGHTARSFHALKPRGQTG